ncbi:Lrp/AsnC family transcriptional regulator [Candidatus Woesearchaeota archaeon]|nr:Lrp/AsnC family transcriptional regulator [Candidatus Woesearchaeota archaeon]
MIKLDQIDKNILFELDKDARRSVKEISKMLKLNRDTVAYRIKQLENNKIITGYYTVIDYSKIGYILTRLYIRFQDTTLDIEEQIINYLISLKSTFTIYKTEGDWDIAVGLLVKSLDEFNTAHKELQEKIKKFIHSQNIAIFLEYIHYFRNYLVEEKLRDYSGFSTGKSQKIDFDSVDLDILKLIAANAKINLLELAKKLNLTSTAINYRIKQLEKKRIILGYRALIDYSNFGYEYYKIDLEIEDLTKLKQLQAFAKQHPNIIYEDRVISGSDFEFDAELQGHEEFYNLIENIKRNFSGIIRTYKYYKARKIYKYTYFPEE